MDVINAISSHSFPASIARPNSAMISEAFTPATYCTNDALSSLVVIKRTKPSVAFNDNARPFPDNAEI